MNIYVGNLAYNTKEDSLREAFAEYGEVGEVNIIMDRETGRSRGFAFIEMPDDNAAKAAIEALNLYRIDDRAITVNEARPREDRGGGGRRGRGGGGGGGGGGGRRW